MKETKPTRRKNLNLIATVSDLTFKFPKYSIKQSEFEMHDTQTTYLLSLLVLCPRTLESFASMNMATKLLVSALNKISQVESFADGYGDGLIGFFGKQLNSYSFECRSELL